MSGFATATRQGLSRRTGSSPLSAPSTVDWVFDVADYGATLDDTGDDQGAVIDALDQAVTWALDNDSSFAVVRGNGVARLPGSTVKGGATAGNAFLPLPVQAPADRKLTIVLQGPAPGSFVHWDQTVGQRFGWTLRCSATGLSSDATWGAPSVIGGPTPQGGYGSNTGLFDNIRVHLDNVGVICPLDPSMIAYDLRGVAQASGTSVTALADGTRTEMLARQQSGYTHSYSSGLLCPQNLNNALVRFDEVLVEGYYTGMSVTEHAAVQYAGIIYCHDGTYWQSGGPGNHAAWVGNLCVEACNLGIYTDGNSVPIGIAVSMYDTESVTTHVDDANSALGGQVLWNDNNNSALAPTVVGGNNLEIIATRRARGNATAPAVPATTVALQNPFWRHAAVTIAGGTVTAIAVDGVATGLTAGTVIVPSGRTVTLTYSSAPTWKWTLM